MIRWYRFLDWLQSAWNTSRKTLAGRRKWGAQWRDKVRPGRSCTRVERIDIPIPEAANYSEWKLNSAVYSIRPEAGWEWYCPNCKEYSLITESMLSGLLEEWKANTARIIAKYNELGLKAPAITPPPTPATAGCTNCKYRPGAPE